MRIQIVPTDDKTSANSLVSPAQLLRPDPTYFALLGTNHAADISPGLEFLIGVVVQFAKVEFFAEP